MSAQNLLYLILAVLAFDFILDKTLDLLNYKHSKKGIPQELESLYSPEEYQKSLAYQRSNTLFGLVTSTFSFILTLLVVFLGVFGWLDGHLRALFSSEILI